MYSIMSERGIRICFAWAGFPQYAARCVGAFVRATGYECVVTALRPDAALGMEDVCNCPVIWTKGRTPVVGCPELEGVTHLFVTGWFLPQYNELVRKVRREGGRAISFVDNDSTVGPSVRDRIRAFLKNVRFRLFTSRMFDGYIVPGKSGRKLLEGYGVPPDLIWEGMDCADETLYHDGAPLAERPKRIIYVGQYIPRKNIVAMAEAFRAENRGDWRLDLYGCGPVAVADGGGVFVHPFLQVEELAEEYRRSRALWLGSHEEHWGLVVHEAALSGCVLALSNRIGAAADLAGADNAVIFDPEDPADMRRAMRHVMDLTDDRLARAQRESLELAGRIGLNTFVEAVRRGLQS